MCAFFRLHVHGDVMKILHFVTGGFSGATQVAIDLCEAAKLTPEFTVKLVLRKKSNTTQKHLEILQAKGIDVEIVPGWAHWVTILRLRNICRQWQPDLLVAHGFSEHIWGRIAGWWGGVPHMVHVEHNSRERYTRPRLWLSKWLVKRTDAIVGVSEGVKSRLLELGFPSHKCMAIPNGIKWHNFQDLHQPHWFSRKSAVLMAARFARQKDPLTLISAIDALSKRGVVVNLSFAGLGKQAVLDRCKRTTQQLGLSESIHFLGQVKAMPQLLLEHQIFVLSTHYEGMPLALLEAMACGCACIGTDVIGVREVIEHGRTGLLVAEGDIHGLAGAIELLISEPQFAQSLGQVARQSVQEKFTTKLMSERYAALFRSLV